MTGLEVSVWCSDWCLVLAMWKFSFISWRPSLSVEASVVGETRCLILAMWKFSFISRPPSLSVDEPSVDGETSQSAKKLTDQQRKKILKKPFYLLFAMLYPHVFLFGLCIYGNTSRKSRSSHAHSSKC